MQHLKLVTMVHEAVDCRNAGPVRGQWVPIGDTEKFQSTAGILVLLGAFFLNREVVKPFLFPTETGGTTTP